MCNPLARPSLCAITSKTKAYASKNGNPAKDRKIAKPAKNLFLVARDMLAASATANPSPATGVA